MSLMLFKEYQKKTSNFIFKLRNKRYVRINSVNNKPIMFRSHEVWIMKFLNKKKIKYS